MRIMVKYCGYCRKDGSYNSVTFDEEAKVFTNKSNPSDKWYRDLQGNFQPLTFVEAYMSNDVNHLREELIKNGYIERD